MIRTWAMLWLGASWAIGAPLKVAALHPLMADLARQVGGDQVEVHDLSGANAHRYEPRPEDMKTMRSAALVLAAGKNMEPWLDRLRSNLGGVPVLEVGATIPGRKVTGEGCTEHAGCSGHAEAGAEDPHWWHGIDAMRRATRVVARALAEKDPAHATQYMNQAAAYSQRLDALKKWARLELAKVPPQRRTLVTAHNAFGYFAAEFGFKVVAVAGLNNEQNVAPRDQARTIEAVKAAGVPAIFPETNSTGKTLDAIVAATGIQLAEPLNADGYGTGADKSFDGMIRHNVSIITKALVPP